MGKRSALIGLLICFGSLSLSGQTAFDNKLQSLYKNTVPLIRESELNKAILKNEKFILLDIRAVEEYNISHIPNAYFVNYNNFTTHKLDTIDRSTTLIVYCSVGYRSERIGEKLIKMGFKDVKNLYGGIFEWVNKGNKVINASGKITNRVHTYNKNWSQWLLKGVKVY